jgi:3-methyladenine DNA glycosylase AlkC
MKEKFSMKDAAFNRNNLTQFSQNIKKHFSDFNDIDFLDEIFSKLFALELKERSTLITQTLYNFLPSDYEKALTILLKAMPGPIEDEELTGYDNFIMMPITGYVSSYGLDNFKLSTDALYEMTKCFTAEFDIRFFILEYPLEMLELLKVWAKDENVHVRRLVSEGLRPRLPWAFQLKKYIENPDEVLEILSILKDDKELYVRRSVANNLNDISKDHPEKVILVLKSWNNETKEFKWLRKHALRTLLKQGHKDALALLGYKASNSIDVTLTLQNSDVYMNSTLQFSLEISSAEHVKIPMMIDYIIWYKKANGNLQSKVFKLKTLVIDSGEKVILKKAHKFADFSTRKHYEGEHRISILINGKSYSEEAFKLNLKEKN